MITHTVRLTCTIKKKAGQLHLCCRRFSFSPVGKSTILKGRIQKNSIEHPAFFCTVIVHAVCITVRLYTEKDMVVNDLHMLDSYTVFVMRRIYLTRSYSTRCVVMAVSDYNRGPSIMENKITTMKNNGLQPYAIFLRGATCNDK